MKKISLLLLILLSLLFLNSCSSDKTEYENVYNYMQSTAILSCGNHFVKLNNRVPYVFSENEENGYSVISNSVELTQAGIIRILYADNVSFYYSTVEASNNYGNGNGYRIYRYFPESGNKELVYSDVSITNFDSTLGLEDIFNISAPTSGNDISFSSGFYFDGDIVIPDYKMKHIILEIIEKQELDIELFSSGFRFAVTDNKVLFADVMGKIWQYNPKIGTIKKFYDETVLNFFVTDKNIFVISSITGKISALDLYGNILKEFETIDADFSLNSLQISDNACFLLDDNCNIWYIDSNLNMSKTLFKSLSGYWCIRDNQIMIFEEDYVLYDIESGLHEKHDFKVVSTVEPSCFEIGRIEYACICGEAHTEEIATLSHIPSKGNLCTDEIICITCKTTLELPKKHDMSSKGIYNNDATCLNNGTTLVKCLLCNHTETLETPNTALGHNMSGEKEYNNDATCYVNGTEIIHCSRCDYTETKTAENTMLEHKDINKDGLCDNCNLKLGNDSLSGIIDGFIKYILEYYMR